MAEDMEIDHIVEVPDTPDRVTVRRDDQKYISNPEKKGRAFNAADEMNIHSNFITLSRSEESNTSQNAPIFRRAPTEEILGRGATRFAGAEKMEKGKSVSSQVPSKTLLGPNVSVDRGKGISLSNDSQTQNEKQLSLPPRLATTPRGRGHKRLVRNGCISPHNIATREKQIAEQSKQQTKDVEQSHAGHLASSYTVSPVSVDDIIAGERSNDRMKGKDVVTVHHPSTRGLTFRSKSSPVINSEEDTDTSNALRNALHYCEMQDGWRTTHNERNANQHLYDANRHHHTRRNNNVRRYNIQNSNRIDRRNTENDQSSNHVHGSQSDHTAQPTSVVIPTVDPSSPCPGHTVGSLTRRQRKRESPLGNPNGSSYNSGIMFPSLCGESSSSSRVLDTDVVELLSTPRSSSSSLRRVLDPEVIELSTPRDATRASEDINNNDNNSSEARARQMEADERLARELQEQLYNDDSFEGRGFDEHLAWELQRAEHHLHTSVDSHDINHPTRFHRANRQPRTRSHQNLSRRRDMPQVSFSNRMSHWRSRVANRTRSPILTSRGRGPRFPLDMDLDMRLDILEALEDSTGDFSDMGMADNIFNVQRDFNEADYELLLALDERNHQHTGASANLINSLPESTIQIDNFAEDCAICLETPAKGETIRHLPCLHKFHKNCIDPWLRQKTSCPVCKSSITS